MNNILKNKCLFITGVTGSIGTNLLAKLLSYNPKLILGIDINEEKIALLNKKYFKLRNIKLLFCDIRNKQRLNDILKNIDYVFHCAALKHVSIAEDSPEEALSINIDGTKNIIDCSNYNNVKKVIFTSSDKAVNPSNFMGITKLLGEKLIINANKYSKTVFSVVRFGNVLGSNGSVLPIFYNQLINKLPLEVTHKDMTRYVMTLSQAIELIIDSLFICKKGDILIKKLESLKIIDLAEIILEKNKISSNKIKIIGIQPGEKMYEELLTEEEISRSQNLKKYISISQELNKNNKFKLQNFNSSNNTHLDKYEIWRIIKPIFNSALLNPINNNRFYNF